nr:translation initiation factor IF-2 N-terminal domain-containing protein [Kofleriaceae bacterium]
MRVYEIAKEVGIPNKDLLVKIRALGLEVNNHMSSLGEDDVARIKRSLEKEKQGGAVEAAAPAKPAAATVVRRRSKADGEGEPVVPATPVEVRPVTPPPVIRRRAVEEPTVAAPTPVAARPVEPPRRDSAPVIAVPAPVVAPTVAQEPAPVAPVVVAPVVA